MILINLEFIRLLYVSDELKIRSTSYGVQKALSVASEEVKGAMKEAVMTSIKEYENVMDFFPPRLKLLREANFKGSKRTVFKASWLVLTLCGIRYAFRVVTSQRPESEAGGSTTGTI